MVNIRKIYNALERLAKEIKALIQASMDKDAELQNSNLYNDMHGVVDDVDLISFFIHDYWQYVEYGAKYTTKRPPLEAIIDWCRTAGINPDNGTAYAIQTAIFKRGLKPRPFFEKPWDEVDDLWDTFADDIVDILFEDFGDMIQVTKES